MGLVPSDNRVIAPNANDFYVLAEIAESALEPYRLRHWRLNDAPETRFYTSARPGRSYGADGNVADKIVVLWLQKLPPNIKSIVSLLGTKPDGMDEHSFYSFFGSELSFEVWLNSLSRRTLEVIPLPTIDFQRVSDDVIVAARAAIVERADNTILLLDSGGEQRSGFVCRQMGAIEVFGE